MLVYHRYVVLKLHKIYIKKVWSVAKRNLWRVATHSANEIMREVQRDWKFSIWKMQKN